MDTLVDTICSLMGTKIAGSVILKILNYPASELLVWVIIQSNASHVVQ